MQAQLPFGSDKRVLFLAAGLLSLCPFSVLMAETESRGQEQSEETVERQQRSMVIEEVIVTARRREETLQDTPVSVTAFGRVDLENIGFADVSDIGRYTPNLDIRQSTGGTDDVNISMRGMFQGDPQITLDPTVGVYLDGVYLARNIGMAFDIVEPERIEVLRGPQGTLFGRNTIGGAINIATQKPRGEFAVRQQITTGRRGRQRFHTTVDTPSLGDFSARVSFLHTDFDGTVKSMHSGRELGGGDSNGGRLQLLWEPDESVNISYAFDMMRSKSQPNFTQVSHVRPLFGDPDGEFYGGGIFDEMNRVSSRSRVGQVPISGRETKSDVDGHALTIQWEATPALLVKSITSYRELDIVDALEFATLRAPDDGSLCGSPQEELEALFVTGTCNDPVPAGELVSFVDSTPSVQQEQWSQEFQVIGSFLDERLNYTAGLYYFEEQGEAGSRDSINVIVSAPFAASQVDQPQAIIDFIVDNSHGNSFINTSAPGRTEIDNRSYAVYGDFMYMVLPELELTLGFRYSRDERTAWRTSTFDDADDPLEMQRVKASETFRKFNPSLTVNYRWSDQIATYAKVATGYRAGGFNTRIDTISAFQTPFQEEDVISYEIGWKGDFLDRTLRFNGAVFYADYSDRQITSSVSDETGVFTDIRNAGDAVHSGLELEAIWQPVSGLRVSAGYAFLDVDIKELFTERLDPVTGLPTNPGVIEDVSSSVKSSFAAEHTGSLIVEYWLEPRSWGELSFRVDSTFTDNVETGNNQMNLFDTLDSHALLNARVKLSDIRVPVPGALELVLWGRNLTNTTYREMGQDMGVLGFSLHRFGELRSYGFDLVYRFDG